MLVSPPREPNFYNKDNNMELILKQDVQNLGFKDDVVTVKNGYGRNYLIPQGFAQLATPSAKKVLAENTDVVIINYDGIEVVEKEIIDSGVKLLTNTSVESMEDVGNKIKINTDKGEVIVDVVVMSIGFRPNTSFTDINKAPNGAIIVNEMSETSETQQKEAKPTKKATSKKK